MVTTLRSIGLAAILFVVAGGFAAATDLLPPKTESLVLVGQVGAAKSDVSRSVLLVGKHLYVAGEPGLATFDVSDPQRPKLTHEWTKTSPKLNAMAVSGTTLYVTNWSPGQGLVVFDISQPDKPRLVRTIATRSHTWTADAFGDWLYVAIDDGTITGINTYDIRDPQNPKLVNFIDVGDRLVNNVARKGDVIYFTHKKWLYAYDVTDAANPKRIGETTFNGLCGKVAVRGDYLYMLSRAIGMGEEGGVHIVSLKDPRAQKPIAHWSQKEPRDFCFVGERMIVPCSGSGNYTLDISRPESIRQLSHWYLSWPNTGKHGGYPVTVSGAGDHVYVGTTYGNDPGCPDFTCPYRGGRVYAVRIFAAK